MQYLYWVHNKSNTDPFSEGYVGITKDLSSRKSAHKKRFPGLTFTILETRNTRDEIKALEKQYRPVSNIGLNIAKGGAGSDMIPETREKIRQTMLAKSVELWTEERRQNVSKAMKGKKKTPFSKSHRDAISKAMKGRRMSEEEKKKRSEGVKRYYELKKKST